MDIFEPENQDLLRNILSYTGRLPRYAAVSRLFYDISEALIPEQIEYMNRHYPLWNVTGQMIEEIWYQYLEEWEEPGEVVYNIALYHLQRAAINSDWDVFRTIVEYQYQNGYVDIPMHAMYIAHLNNNRDLALQLYRRYIKGQRDVRDYGEGGVILFYRLIDEPGVTREYVEPAQTLFDMNILIPPSLYEAIGGTSRLRIVPREGRFSLTRLSDEELFNIIYPTEYARLLIQYHAENPDVPEDLIRFTIRYDMIDKIEDPTLKADVFEDWIEETNDEIATTRFFNLYMIREVDKFFSDPNINRQPTVDHVTPILLKGSNTIWNYFTTLDDEMKKQLLTNPAMKLAYLQKLSRPITLESVLLNEL